MNKTFFLILISAFSLYKCTSGQEKIFNFSPDELQRKTSIYFTSGWKYNPYDNQAFALPGFNDSNWIDVNTNLPGTFKNNWKGTGWFRFHFTIDSGLYNNSVYLHIQSAGDQQVYLDGDYIADNSNWKNPKILTFTPNRYHLIAVKYINENIDYYNNAGFSPGFRIGFGNVEQVIKSGIKELRRNFTEQMFFTAITLAFGLLHFILFLFNRQFKENLVYSIFLLIYAASMFTDYQSNLSVSTTELLFYLKSHRILMSLSQVFAVLSLYSILKQKIKLSFWLIIIYFIAASALAVMKPVQNFVFLQLGLMLVLVECFRVVIKSSKQKTEGVWIIAAGFLILFLFSFYDWLLDFNLINKIGDIDNGYPFGTIGLFICMSVFLSRSFAGSNLKIIQQENLNKEQEIERKYLEAENKRKSLELEDARKLQLSILPKSFPVISNLEIYADMRTAAEVGGDYYDYHLSSDGTITLAIGDATGHGIKAGILVTLIKSLFDAKAHTFFIPDFFNHCTRTIKKMNLGNLYMGMTILKIREYRITASAAGMPPFLIYRHNTNSIEEVVLKGMPLGAFFDYPYQQKIFKVEPGDVILLLTDGMIELFNAQREMIDYDSVKNIFSEAARNNSPNIISELLATADRWLNGYPQMDDITFIVVKVK